MKDVPESCVLIDKYERKEQYHDQSDFRSSDQMASRHCICSDLLIQMQNEPALRRAFFYAQTWSAGPLSV